MTRDELPQLFKDKGFKVGAEIGVLKGEFTEKLCKAGLKVYGIDPWQAQDYHLKNNPNYQKKRDQVYKSAVKRLTPYDCILIRTTSMDALSWFEDESLDFVYIDADHHFRYFAEDLVEWTKKVKKGGIVAGHDYFASPKIQVPFVLDAYAKAFNIHFYVTGELRPSWYFIR